MLKKVFVSLVAVSLSLIAVEGALRTTGRFRPRSYPPIGRRPDLYQSFEPYGYRLWPSRTTTYLYPAHDPRALTVVSNSDGFRSSREFDEPDERPRIMVVGDSFVFGEGVEEAERFTDVLEAMEPGWRVDSLGMPGYGPGLMLRALEAVGLKCHPNVVVLSMYTDVFRRVRPYYAGAGFEIPRFVLRSGRLVSVPYPRPRPWDRLRTVVALQELYWRRSNAELALNSALLDRFLKLAGLYSFVPAIVFLPGRADTTTDKARRAWLRGYAEEHGVAFLDLTASIHAAGGRAFIPRNPHFNPYGHRIVAVELHRFLVQRVLARR